MTDEELNAMDDEAFKRHLARQTTVLLNDLGAEWIQTLVESNGGELRVDVQRLQALSGDRSLVNNNVRVKYLPPAEIIVTMGEEK